MTCLNVVITSGSLVVCPESGNIWYVAPGTSYELAEPRRGMKRGNGFAEVLRSFGGSEPLFLKLDVLKIFVMILVAVVKMRIHI